MTEQGKIVSYTTDVYTPTGIEQREVTRAGVFTVISDGEYLLWDPNKQQLQQLSRQPPARFLDTVTITRRRRTGSPASPSTRRAVRCSQCSSRPGR